MVQKAPIEEELTAHGKKVRPWEKILTLAKYKDGGPPPNKPFQPYAKGQESEWQRTWCRNFWEKESCETPGKEKWILWRCNAELEKEFVQPLVVRCVGFCAISLPS